MIIARQRVRKSSVSTPKRKAPVFKFLRFEKRFRKNSFLLVLTD